MSTANETRTQGISGSFLGRLRFSQKLAVLPGLAGLAFGLILGLTVYYQGQNLEHVEAIEREFLPTLEASRDLEDLLSEIQRGLHDAAAAENADALTEADAKRAAFVARIGALGRANRRTEVEIERLRTAFSAYYTLARGTTARLISTGVSDTLVEDLQRMSDGYNQIRDTLQTGTARDRREMAAAFQSARRANETSTRYIVLITIVVLVILISLSLAISRSAIRQLNLVSEGFARIGRGDFGSPVVIVLRDELGELGVQLNGIAHYLDELVRNIRRTAAQVNSAASEMASTASEHQRGASEQSSAVEETQRTMQSILASTEQVNAAIDTVLHNAEQTLAKNQVIAESISTLSAQTDGITEVLSTIKDIANKAELLALNAALEGTKAGEVGRGFSLVATQMQRLAENVQRAVGDIKSLTETIRRASAGSVLATEEGTKLATDTTRSAREIRLVTQQHQNGTRQVSLAMDDVAGVAQQAAASSRQIQASSEDLAALSQQLLDVTSRFRISSDHDGAR